ncbi:MAG: TAXI family TRAP transporter solute-binding subunit [Alphaproteobacteria bacterium]|nr:MAG: TAXI family TRAP transporter solute-binding subunit [Alphaproteobacteria bacterium]
MLGAAAAAFSASGLLRAAAQDQAYLFATGTTGGTYYPVGVAVATLTKVKLAPSTGISLSAINSAGSAENVKLLRENQAQFAILMGLYGDWAYTGTGDLEAQGPMENLRSVCMLWRNVEHFLIRSKFAATGTMEDLKGLEGKRFSIGKRNSGAEGGTRLILESLGIDPDTSFDLAYLGYGPTADAMQNGTVVATNLPAGPPVSAVTQAFASLGEKVTLLNFTDAQIAQVNSGGHLWARHVLPAGTYPGQSEDVTTIAEPNIMATRSDVPAEAVYQITKAIYENLTFLQNIHKATLDMALETAIEGLPVPLHLGAAQYYREAGLTIPDRLIVD